MNDPQELAALVAEFGKAYTRWIHSVMQKETGTTPARARLLAALQCQGASNMTELSRQLDVTPRNITKLVDALEGESLVARAAHPDDRRATLVHLTEDGVLAAKEIVLADQAVFEGLYAKLPAADREHLGRILKRLMAELEAMDG